MSKSWFSLLLPALLLVLPTPVLASAEKLQEMSEMFDRLDREDFLDGLERVDECTARRDFACADAELSKIKKLVNGRGDQRLWAQASANRVAEQQRMQGEQEQRQQALLRQRQVAQERQEQARQQAWQQQQQQAAEDGAGDFQWGKAAALLGGAAVGGLSQLPVETQVQVVSGLLQDSSGGQDGISNTQNAIDTASASADSYGGSSSGGGSAVPGDPAFDAGAQACQAEAEQNGQPYNDPQVDTLCMLATFNQCVSRKFNYSGYDAQTAATCNNLRGLVSAMGVSNQCSACR
jgi:hypothetical protein